MSDDETKIMDDDRASFERHVLAELESFRGEFQRFTNQVHSFLQSFDRKLDVVNSELLSVKAEQRILDDKMRKLQADNKPQVITQDRQF
jgi:hypothetical protein